MSEVIERRVLTEPQYRDDGAGLTWQFGLHMLLGWMGGSRLRVENRGRWRFWRCELRESGWEIWRIDWRVIYFLVYLHKLYTVRFELKKSRIDRFHSGKGSRAAFQWSTREALEKH